MPISTASDAPIFADDDPMFAVSSEGSAGTLILAGTPIGDARYVSNALRSSLSNADIIAAEDTRKFADLRRRASIDAPGRIISYFEGNEEARTPELIDALTRGERVVLVTDAGMPSVSDPGFRLVAAAIAAGINVSAVPGPSAVLTALAVSGLACDRFCFEGFLPRKTGPRRSRLANLAHEERTMVFFEAPHRVAAFLADAAESFGENRPAAVCRELTKTHEEVIRGPLGDLVAWAQSEVRGEITIVVAGAPPVSPSLDQAIEEVNTLVANGQKRSSAVSEVASRSALNRRDLYNAVLGK